MSESVVVDTLSRITRSGVLGVKQLDTKKRIITHTKETNSSVCLNEERAFIDLCHHRPDCALKLRNFRYHVHVVHKFKHVTHGQQERLYLVVTVFLILQGLQVEKENQYLPDQMMDVYTNLVNERQHLPCELGIRMDLQMDMRFRTE
jgi:hypothetical protein